MKVSEMYGVYDNTTKEIVSVHALKFLADDRAATDEEVFGRRGRYIVGTLDEVVRWYASDNSVFNNYLD